MRRLSLGVVLVLGSILALQAQSRQPAEAPKRSALVKLAAAWPDEERMRERRVDAERRALFQTSEPLTFTLTADFKAVTKDRREKSPKRYPATLTVTSSGPTANPLQVMLGTRGHFRLRPTSCSFVPLRVEFPKDGVTGTVFDGQRALKLVTHCRDSKQHEQYTLREYLVYKIFNLLTPRSFRARLAKVTYVEAESGKQMTTRYAMFLEDDDDVARRVNGRIAELPNALFADVDQESLTLMMLFEYMIGSTDFSITRLHNVVLIQDQTRMLYAVPYDFDLTGLVNTDYALVDKRLGIGSVRERLYRGPCRSQDQSEPVLERLRTKKAEIFAVYDSLPDLDPSYRREAQEYLEAFYATISRSGSVKKLLVDGCSRARTM